MQGSLSASVRVHRRHEVEAERDLLELDWRARDVPGEIEGCIILKRGSEPVEIAEDDRAEPRQTLVAIDERMVVRQGVEQCGGLV